MPSPEKIDIPQEQPPKAESRESPAREKWTKQTSDLLKKFWFASLVVALPSLAEAPEPVKFEDVWKTLTSGRASTAEAGTTITERSSNPAESISYLRAYRSYNARLDSLLQLVPVKDIGEYLESYGVDFNSITPFQKDFRFLPVHEPNAHYMAEVGYFKPESNKKGFVRFNTAFLSPVDTVKTQLISVHELGHFIKRKNLIRIPSVVEEGLAHWGAWKFMRGYLGKQNLNDEEIKSRLSSVLENISYSGDTLLAALIERLYKKQNLLKEYYAGNTSFIGYENIAGASRKLGGIIHKDTRIMGDLGPSEVMDVLRHLIIVHGLESFKKAYEELKSKYFLDITEKNLGTLRWEGSLVYFDRTIKKPPFRTEGRLCISAPSGTTVMFRYDEKGLRELDDIISRVKQKMFRTGESILSYIKEANPDDDVSFIDILVHPSMSLKETDGSLRKEIKDILDPKSSEKMAKK